MRNVGDVSNSKTCFPVGAVDKGSAITRVFCVFTRPSLHSHVVNVNPAATSGFPCNFVFPDLDDGVTYTRCRNTRKCSRSAALEVEVSNGDATTCFTQSRVALLVVWVGYEDVSFSIDHVWIEVVRAARMVDIVP